MRAPLKWLAEYVDLGEMTGRELAEKLISAGLEVETVDEIGGDVTGPVVIGKVLSFEAEPQKNGKIIRYCQVDVGEANGGVRGIVCGAQNFAPGDHVIVSLPGAVLPGGFEIAARKTYGHISDGMICAEDELGIGHDHTGIMVLGDTDDNGQPWVLGTPALDAIGIRDDVLDIAVTPDMGYCFSIRGLAREAAQAMGKELRDPVNKPLAAGVTKNDGYPVRIDDEACSLFTAIQVRGIDPKRPTPRWMSSRLAAAGMRSLSLPVDISNYVMLETGQPNHAYDGGRLSGAIQVRRARAGEKLVTLDEVERKLDVEDLVIADDSGAIGLAGLMGGFTTELNDETTDVVIEAAAFDPITVARMSRRHKLSSEASRRFERGVDPQAAYAAAHRVAELLVQLAGGTLLAEETIVGGIAEVPSCTFKAQLVSDILGMDVPAAKSVEILTASGCDVAQDGDSLTVTAPTWRPDLREPYEFVEEVGRKLGFETIPTKLVTPPPGRGFTRAQRARKELMRALVASGFVEVLSFPFISDGDLDNLMISEDDLRRHTVRVANPLADTAPLLRTTLLPGLFQAVNRNASRSQDDVALVEFGSAFFAGNGKAAPEPSVVNRPSDDDLKAIEAALPKQPKFVAGVVAGNWVPATWQGGAVKAGWEQIFAACDAAVAALGVKLTRHATTQAPWHQGRCAALFVGNEVVGFAGELHPKVCKAASLPARTAAFEINLDALIAAAPTGGSIAPISPWPAVKEDIALVVDESVPVGELQAVIEDAGTELLESVALFDIYRGAPLAEGKKSVAYAMRFRAMDRTLTAKEVAELRDAIVAAAAEKFGAELRTY